MRPSRSLTLREKETSIASLPRRREQIIGIREGLSITCCRLLAKNNIKKKEDKNAGINQVRRIIWRENVIILKTNTKDILTNIREAKKLSNKKEIKWKLKILSHPKPKSQLLIKSSPKSFCHKTRSMWILWSNTTSAHFYKNHCWRMALPNLPKFKRTATKLSSLEEM